MTGDDAQALISALHSIGRTLQSIQKTLERIEQQHSSLNHRQLAGHRQHRPLLRGLAPLPPTSCFTFTAISTASVMVIYRPFG